MAATAPSTSVLTSGGARGMSLALQSGAYPLETQHASLKRKKEPAPMPPVLYSPVMEKNEVLIWKHSAISRCSLCSLLSELLPSSSFLTKLFHLFPVCSSLFLVSHGVLSISLCVVQKSLVTFDIPAAVCTSHT
jgi:hypothetical protein